MPKTKELAPAPEPVEELDTKVILSLQTLNEPGELFFEDVDGRLYYLDQTMNRGLYILRPQNG